MKVTDYVDMEKEEEMTQINNLCHEVDLYEKSGCHMIRIRFILFEIIWSLEDSLTNKVFKDHITRPQKKKIIFCLLFKRLF